jgi:hypothetical protein
VSGRWLGTAFLLGGLLNPVREAAREWAWLLRLVVGALLSLLSSLVFAQASSVVVPDFAPVVCAPASASSAGAVPVTISAVHTTLGCGTDASGNALTLMVLPGGSVASVISDTPVEGGEQTGIDIGFAVLSVMAAAWGFRALRRLVEGGSGDG